MSGNSKVKIGFIGTGWWSNTMHMPALATCDAADVVAVCGRNPERLTAFAQKWGIPQTFTDYREMLASDLFEAVFVVTSNDSHYPIAMAALDRGYHVLCEKPLALDYQQASEMAALAAAKGVITTVPFTYRHMPSTRYLKTLIDGGWLGRPYHLHMRYYAAFARTPGQYLWRFDKKLGGSGALADIGSHFLHLAEWFYGPVEAVCAQLGAMIERAPLDLHGQPYEQADDTAMVMLRFKNGAQGLVHASAIAYERTYADHGYGFDQVHEWDFHGSEGTLRQVIDWDFRQNITGDRSGDGPERQLLVPAEFWGDKRRDYVIETWEDTFRKEGRMVHEFVKAVASRQPMVPTFADGARCQQLLDAAIQSAETGTWVTT
jgi:predicted dehydrogenase